MRKSHEKVARAFLARGSARAVNVWTNGEELRLFGVVVARWKRHAPTLVMHKAPVDDDQIIANPDTIQVTWAGWVTRTTRAVLNAIAECAGAKMRFHLDKREPMARNIEDGTAWRVDSRQWLELV